MVLGAFVATQVYATPSPMDIYGGFDPGVGIWTLRGPDGVTPLNVGDCVCIYWKGPNGVRDGLDFVNAPEPADDDVLLECIGIGPNDGATGPAFFKLGLGTFQSGGGHPAACEEIYVCIFDDPCADLDPSNYFAYSDQYHVLNQSGETFFAKFPGDPGGGYTDTPLPVELMSFDAIARDGEVLLEWKTASETNALGFYIERDGERINQELIPAAGHATTENTYTYADRGLTNGVTYYYDLFTQDLDGVTMKANTEPMAATPMAHVPTVFALHQNYPNPFNPYTDIKYDLPEDVHVTLKVYNILGAEVATLVNTKQQANFYTVRWDAENLASGVYFCTITAGDNKAVRKMVLMK